MQAKADPCKPLLDALHNYLTNNSGYINFLQTTNYQRNIYSYQGYWAGAYAYGGLQLATGGPILSGTASRTWSDGRTDQFSIEFYADASVRFAGQYGPYPTTCYGNKFLIVNTWDSLETFTFVEGPILL